MSSKEKLSAKGGQSKSISKENIRGLRVSQSKDKDLSKNRKLSSVPRSPHVSSSAEDKHVSATARRSSHENQIYLNKNH